MGRASPSAGSRSRRAAHKVMALQANNALERTVNHRGPRLAAALAAWPAAQLGRSTVMEGHRVATWLTVAIRKNEYSRVHQGDI